MKLDARPNRHITQIIEIINLQNLASVLPRI